MTFAHISILYLSNSNDFRIVPSGCTDIIASNAESTAQNESKENKESKEKKEIKESKDETPDANGDVNVNANAVSTENATNKEENVEKPEKPEKQDKPSKLQNTTYIFTRYSKEPAVVIPSADHFTVVVRCCPTIFKLRAHNENNPPLIDLPYRMIYAIASKSSVYLYDTQQRLPFGSISNIHYSRLTDVTWSSDGKIMIISSFDGFCTLIAFEDGELGEVYDEPINMIEHDDKAKKKRNSNDKSNNTSPKEQKGEHKSEQNNVSTPTTSGTTKDNVQMAVKPKMEFPESIIASVETFESPEYKEKQATPIAIRRTPRTNPSTPSTATGATPQSSETEQQSASAKKPKLIAIRRQPRNILPSPAVVEKSTADQDEALDAWPIPIDAVKTVQEKSKAPIQDNQPMIIEDKTEDMHLVYEGDSELTLIKTETVNEASKSASKLTETSAEVKNSETSANEQHGTPDTKNQKTPRRVEFRTISTPKSKKKLIN